MTHDQLDSIAKGGVEETTHGLTQLDRDLLGSEGEDSGEGDDGEEVDDEDGGGAPAHGTGDDAEGHRGEQEVDIVWTMARKKSGLAHSIQGR